MGNTKPQLKPMREYSFFIGANNITHEVEHSKINEILNGIFKNFTVTNAEGHYNGIKENSCIVSIISDSNKELFIDAAQLLKRELKQECVLLTMRNIHGALI